MKISVIVVPVICRWFKIKTSYQTILNVSAINCSILTIFEAAYNPDTSANRTMKKNVISIVVVLHGSVAV